MYDASSLAMSLDFGRVALLAKGRRVELLAGSRLDDSDERNESPADKHVESVIGGLIVLFFGRRRSRCLGDDRWSRFEFDCRGGSQVVEPVEELIIAMSGRRYLCNIVECARGIGQLISVQRSKLEQSKVRCSWLPQLVQQSDGDERLGYVVGFAGGDGCIDADVHGGVDEY